MDANTAANPGSATQPLPGTPALPKSVGVAAYATGSPFGWTASHRPPNSLTLWQAI
jgi:hypothetical protein